MTNANDPAFTGPTEKGYTPGLTKLEYFAAMAMQGMLVNGAMQAHGTITLNPEYIAVMAINQAKELITELNKEA